MQADVTIHGFQEHLGRGWIFPAQMARRWGLSERAVLAFIRNKVVDYVRGPGGHYLLDPKQGFPSGRKKS